MAKEKDFSVSALIAWLKTMPADESYDWMDASNCALGQWCGSMGLRGEARRRKSVKLGEDDTFYQIALQDTYDPTFGKALRKALAIPSPTRGGGA